MNGWLRVASWFHDFNGIKFMKNNRIINYNQFSKEENYEWRKRDTKRREILKYFKIIDLLFPRDESLGLEAVSLGRFTNVKLMYRGLVERE